MAVPEEQKLQMMAYLDGEMTSGERQGFEQVLMQTPDLQQELAQFQRLQSLIGRVRIPEPKPELWDEQPRHPQEKLWRVVGWILLISGSIIVALASEYLLWSTDNTPWILKLGATLMVAGLGVLLGSVIQRRYRESKTDRYREIIR